MSPLDHLAFRSDSGRGCSIYNEWNPTGDEFLISGYEGLPQNLLVNTVCFMLFIILFCWGRRYLWNFGRIAVKDRNRLRFREAYTRESDTEMKLIPDDKDYIITTKKSIADVNFPEFDDSKLNDNGWFGWIKIVFTLTDDHLFVKGGYDACMYLSFQRHLMFILTIICITSMTIILPIHMVGTELRETRDPDSSVFSQTTIGNIAPDDPVLFIHVTLGFFYLILTCIVMKHFIRGLMRKHKDNFQPRTVTIFGIPSKMCHAEKVRGHLEEAYPTCKIENISFVFGCKNVNWYEWYKEAALSALSYVLGEYENTKKRPTIRPVCCGFNIKRICKNPEKEVDAIQYYSKKIRDLKHKADFERARTLGRPMGAAFVTFRSVLIAEKMISDYDGWKRFVDRFISRVGPFKVDRTPKTHYSQKLVSKRWTVGSAPLSSDIVWENYGVPLMGWYMKWVMVNVAVILMALCFSTPIILLKTLNYYIQFHKGHVKQPKLNPEEHGLWNTIVSIFLRLLPTFLIWVGATTLPCLVSVSDLMIAYWTTSALNYSRMIKTYIFLVMMVIILPSFGLSSIAYMINEDRLKWECIYDSRNQSFYINYIITSCFIGCAAELWRMPELFLLACKMLFKKSAADDAGNLAYCLWEFQVGSQYAWMLLPFTITALFSLVNPLITIFGLLYLFIKHYVDRYNIFFAYSRCHVYKEIHQGAAQLVIICMLMIQIVVTTYIQLINWTTISTHTYLHGYSTFITCTALFLFCLKNHFDSVEPINLVYREDGHSLPQYSTPYSEYDQPLSDSDETDAETIYSTEARTEKHSNKSLVPLNSPLPHRKRRRRHALPQVHRQYSQTYFQTIPRIPIQPNNPYFPPYLRKDYPFTYPGQDIRDTKKLSIQTPTAPETRMSYASKKSSILDFLGYSVSDPVLTQRKKQSLKRTRSSV